MLVLSGIGHAPEPREYTVRVDPRQTSFAPGQTVFCWQTDLTDSADRTHPDVAEFDRLEAEGKAVPPGSELHERLRLRRIADTRFRGAATIPADGSWSLPIRVRPTLLSMVWCSNLPLVVSKI